MDLLSLEPKSTQNLVPTCFSSLTFITFLHKLYTLAKVGKSSYMLCFESSESSRTLLFSMFICAILSYQYSYPQKAALIPLEVMA